MAEEKKKGSLPEAVQKKFTVAAGFGIGEIAHAGKHYDLTKISVEVAEQLVKDGCKVLIPVQGAPAPDKK